jgi:hypothetical protein
LRVEGGGDEMRKNFMADFPTEFQIPSHDESGKKLCNKT